MTSLICLSHLLPPSFCMAFPNHTLEGIGEQGLVEVKQAFYISGRNLKKGKKR